jgi:hypothetical protein
MRISRWCSLALVAAVTVVLVAPVGAQEVEIKPAVKVKRDKYVLTADEIAERPDIVNAYDAVKLLRPNFLKPTRARGSMSATGAYRGDRPTTDLTPKSLHGSGESGSGSSGSGGDKPTGMETGSSGGSSPYGGSSGGASASLMPVLYFDEIKQENVDELKNVRVADIVEIRYMGGTEASGRFGSGHEGGAILVKMKKVGGN